MVKCTDKKHLKKNTEKMIKRKKVRLIYIVGLLILLALGYLSYVVFQQKKDLPDRHSSPQFSKITTESQFTKEGELSFLKKTTKERIQRIDIELADNPYEIVAGLMYRHSLPDATGMLFIFDRSQPLFFWMKNTYIPLDIIFADKNMQIVTIHKNTQPLSEDLLPSYNDSQYVVEVNAGFCDKHKITIGDYIAF